MEKSGNKTTLSGLLLALPLFLGFAFLFSSCETTGVSTMGTARKDMASRSNKKAVKGFAKRSSTKNQPKTEPIRKNKEGRLVATPVMLIGTTQKADEARIIEPKPISRSSSPIILASAGTSTSSNATPAFSSTLRPALVPPGGMMMVRTTAYCHKEADHLVYGRKNAIDGTLKYGGLVRSAAADWSKYPVGTRFRITGLPYEFVVDDYGSALVGTGTIDIYQPSFAAMNAWGVRNVPIQVIQWGSFEMSRRILDGRKHVRHADHVRTMLREIERRGMTSVSAGTTDRKISDHRA